MTQARPTFQLKAIKAGIQSRHLLMHAYRFNIPFDDFTATIAQAITLKPGVLSDKDIHHHPGS
jgi:hypothetical protein